MVPDLDTLRPHLGMKESSIGKIWAEAIGLSSHSSQDYLKLTKFTDPNYAGLNACGDLSIAVYEVMMKRYPSFESSNNRNRRSRSSTKMKGKKRDKGLKKKNGVTIGQMNDLLDELAMVKALQLRSSSTNSDSQPQPQSQSQSVSSAQSQSLSQSLSQSFSQFDSTSLSQSQDIGGNRERQRGGGGRRKKLNKKCKEQRVQWVQKLIDLKLSPLEHKWIVRIILSELNLGIRSDSIIEHLSKYAEGLYSANKNLRTLCATLCDKEWVKKRKEKDEREKVAVDNWNR